MYQEDIHAAWYLHAAWIHRDTQRHADTYRHIEKYTKSAGADREAQLSQLPDTADDDKKRAQTPKNIIVMT
jgi:hypothetical protein